MTALMVNRERLAWDGARIVVRVFGSEQACRWLRGQLAARVDAELARALAESRLRMWESVRPDAPQVEAGIWRVRLGELLADDPSLAVPLREILAEAAERLAVATDVRVHGERPPTPRVIDLGTV